MQCDSCLLEAGVDAVQLAAVFGWKLRCAAQRVEVHTVVGGDKTGKILELVAKAEKRASGAKVQNAL